MSLPPKVPPVYKPTPVEAAAPPVYRPQQTGKPAQPKVGKPAVQPKAGTQVRTETHPAPPVYRPQAGAQMKAAPASGKNIFRKPVLIQAKQAEPAKVHGNKPRLAHEQPHRPIQLKPVTSTGLQAGKKMVVQRVRAYRVGTSKSSYKIQIKNGKIESLSGGNTGIDISFGDAEHANYYFATKKSDAGAVLDEWEFPDDVYELIVHRMNNPMKQACPNPKKEKLWDEIKKLPAPVNSTDVVVTRGGLIAPHFPLAWIDILEKYSKGKAVTRTTVAEAFPPPPPVVVAGFKDTDIGTVYLPADTSGPEIVEGQMTYGKYLAEYQSGGYQFR